MSKPNSVPNTDGHAVQRTVLSLALTTDGRDMFAAHSRRGGLRNTMNRENLLK